MRVGRRVSAGVVMGVVVVCAALVLSALKDSIVFFNSPTDVAEKHVVPGTRIRLGGLVKPGTVQRGDQLAVRFDALLSEARTMFEVIIIDLPPLAAVADARTRWSAVKAEGFEATYWQADENGRWVKKA